MQSCLHQQLGCWWWCNISVLLLIANENSKLNFYLFGAGGGAGMCALGYLWRSEVRGQHHVGPRSSGLVRTPLTHQVASPALHIRVYNKEISNFILKCCSFLYHIEIGPHLPVLRIFVCVLLTTLWFLTIVYYSFVLLNIIYWQFLSCWPYWFSFWVLVFKVISPWVFLSMNFVCVLVLSLHSFDKTPICEHAFQFHYYIY